MKNVSKHWRRSGAFLTLNTYSCFVSSYFRSYLLTSQFLHESKPKNQKKIPQYKIIEIIKESEILSSHNISVLKVNSQIYWPCKFLFPYVLRNDRLL